MKMNVILNSKFILGLISSVIVTAVFVSPIASHANTPNDYSYIRFVNSSPKIEQFDVKSNNQLIFMNVKYGQPSHWLVATNSELQNVRIFKSGTNIVLHTVGNIKLKMNQAFTFFFVGDPYPDSINPAGVLVSTTMKTEPMEQGKCKIRAINLGSFEYDFRLKSDDINLIDKVEYQKFTEQQEYWAGVIQNLKVYKLTIQAEKETETYLTSFQKLLLKENRSYTFVILPVDPETNIIRLLLLPEYNFPEQKQTCID